MGEVLELLKDKREDLIRMKAFVQGFDMVKCNNQINKLNQLITLVEQNGG